MTKIDLGIKSLVSEIEKEPSLEEMYKAEIELIEAKADLDIFMYEFGEVYTGYENLISISKVLEENEISDDLKAFIGDSLKEIGIDLDNEETSQEGMVDAIKLGVRKVIEFIKLMIAKVKDFVKKYVGVQKIRSIQLKKKAEAFKKADWEKIKDQKVKVMYGKDIVTDYDNISKMAEAIEVAKSIKINEAAFTAKTETGMIFKGLVEKVKQAFTKYKVAKIDVNADDADFLQIIAGEYLTAPSKELKERAVVDLGWKDNTELADAAEALSKKAKTWADSPMYANVQKSMAETQAVLDKRFKEVADNLDKKAFACGVKVARASVAIQQKILLTSGRVLNDIETSILAIPVK